MAAKLLEINLFGACVVRGAGDADFEITGAKHKALFVLLATAPFGRRTRSYLQDTLWATSCYDNGRQSLRRALSDLRHIMGDMFDLLLTVTNSELTLDLSRVHFIGRPGGGQYLEGLDIREDGFNRWLGTMRANPEQLYGLFSMRSQPPAPAPVPCVSILPFQLVAGDAHHVVLGDWLAEEISRTLSRSSLLAVVSHLSARELASRRIELSKVRDLLGVDYFMAGSLRVEGQRAILDADFLDAVSGRILWTRRFSALISEFMSEYSEAVDGITRTIGRAVASDVICHIRGRAARELADHQLLVAGVGLMHELNLPSFARSREMLEEAARRMPRAAEVHAWLSEWYVMCVFNGWSTDVPGDTARAADASARALDIDPESAFCLTIDGVVHNTLLTQIDAAEERFEAALARNPNEALSWLLSSVVYTFRDEGSEAVSRVEKALRLSPLDPMLYFFESLAGSAYLAAGDYDKALDFSTRSLERNDRHVSTLRARICALHKLGRCEEAREMAGVLMARLPNFTVSSYLKSHPSADFQFGQSIAGALTASGVPYGGK
ncbi:hypothetical protein [Hoeflea alexandrii]|uniref:hypothetical protein n=1 Tax=Hoeflea alexandrii TaxID=288436 RepID=UPI0022AF654C|nr:hypothetical protein [Hoeflea alexandrii]MCZ4287551.1 hypothetical protein [Hoeflea alexandrii]